MIVVKKKKVQIYQVFANINLKDTITSWDVIVEKKPQATCNSKSRVIGCLSTCESNLDCGEKKYTKNTNIKPTIKGSVGKSVLNPFGRKISVDNGIQNSNR